jgi:hypothetical protein
MGVRARDTFRLVAPGALSARRRVKEKCTCDEEHALGPPFWVSQFEFGAKILP